MSEGRLTVPPEKVLEELRRIREEVALRDRNRRTVLDTNVWIYGLRQDPERCACTQLLESLSSLRVVIPR